MTDEQQEAERIRKLRIEVALIGLWRSDATQTSWFFQPDNEIDIMFGEVARPLGITGNKITYEVFIKDNNPYLKIVNYNGKEGEPPQIKEYKILLIDEKQNPAVLDLEIKHGGQLNFRRLKVMK